MDSIFDKYINFKESELYQRCCTNPLAETAHEKVVTKVKELKMNDKVVIPVCFISKDVNEPIQVDIMGELMISEEPYIFGFMVMMYGQSEIFRIELDNFRDMYRMWNFVGDYEVVQLQ